MNCGFRTWHNGFPLHNDLIRIRTTTSTIPEPVITVQGVATCYGVNTRRLRSSVANTLARFSACFVSSASCPSVANKSVNTATTSCTLSTKLRVCRGEAVWAAIFALSSVSLRSRVRQFVRCVWKSGEGEFAAFAVLLLRTNNLDEVTNLRTSSVNASLASCKINTNTYIYFYSTMA